MVTVRIAQSACRKPDRFKCVAVPSTLSEQNHGYFFVARGHIVYERRAQGADCHTSLAHAAVHFDSSRRVRRFLVMLLNVPSLNDMSCPHFFVFRRRTSASDLISV